MRLFVQVLVKPSDGGVFVMAVSDEDEWGSFWGLSLAGGDTCDAARWTVWDECDRSFQRNLNLLTCESGGWDVFGEPLVLEAVPPPSGSERVCEWVHTVLIDTHREVLYQRAVSREST